MILFLLVCFGFAYRLFLLFMKFLKDGVLLGNLYGFGIFCKNVCLEIVRVNLFLNKVI